MMKFYLAHPFDMRHNIRSWELQTEVKLDIQLINPFYDITREDITLIDEGLKERYDVDSAVLVKRDLSALRSCDGLIAFIGGDGFIAGTLMEIMYAFVAGVSPIYIVVTNGHERHPWLQYTADRVFTSVQDLEDYLSVL